MQYQSSCNDLANSIILTTRETIFQRSLSRDQDLFYIPDIVVDPVLSPSGSMVVDKVGEVPKEKYLDIDAMFVGIDVRKGSTTFALSTFGLIPKQPLNTAINYYFIVDLDNNPENGGEPSNLDIPSNFEGAEFVAKVEVAVDDEANYTAKPTIWGFSEDKANEAISPINESFIPNKIKSEVLTDRIMITPDPGTTLDDYSEDIANIITLDVSNDLRGLVSDSIRLQTLSNNPLTEAGDTGEGTFTLIQPSFPTCQVEPSAGKPREKFVVHATALVPNSDVHAILGDKEVAKGVTDAAGIVFLGFKVPRDTNTGVRLMTVGTGALTADCTLKIIPSGTFSEDSTTKKDENKEEEEKGTRGNKK